MCAGANFTIDDLDVDIYMGYYGAYIAFKLGDERPEYKQDPEPDDDNSGGLAFINSLSKEQLVQIVTKMIEECEE